MLLTLQTRLKTLIEADAYFSGLTVITEKDGDLATAIETVLARLSFAVFVNVAEGVVDVRSDSTPLFIETFHITIVQAPLTDGSVATRNPVDALEHIIGAVHRKPLVAASLGPDRFEVTSHESLPEPGFSVQRLTVLATAILN